MAGEYDDAISRVNDLIATAHENSVYYTLQARTRRDAMMNIMIIFFLQAYMYFLFGYSRLEHKDYEGAIQSFERALTQTRRYPSRRLWTVSLVGAIIT